MSAEPVPFAQQDAAVAVVYQAALPPPLGVGGAVKPAKPGGYADSGADIAAALAAAGAAVVTPAGAPRRAVDADWVWPDTAAGVAAAVAAGATVVWANTGLWGGHPLAAWLATGGRGGAAAGGVGGAAGGGGLRIVGHPPATVERYDDKAVAAAALRRWGIPVPPSMLVTAAYGGGGGSSSRARAASPAGPTPPPVHVDDLDERRLAAAGVGLPAIVKPLRGRGSSGVTRVDSVGALAAAVRAVAATTGGGALVEAYLPGEEVTLTVMPPGVYTVGGGGGGGGDGGGGRREVVQRPTHWALPPIARGGHVRGVVPYSGDVAVTANSAAVPPAVAAADPAYAAVGAAAAAAAAALGATAIVRIDARRGVAAAGSGSRGNGGGGFALFDVNFKPNLTAAGRPGRDDQDSLVVLAARAAGWTYQELLLNALRQAWGGGVGGEIPAGGAPPPPAAVG